MFTWQLILRRLSILINITRRGVLADGAGLNCVLCSDQLEAEGHLFCRCSFCWEGLVFDFQVDRNGCDYIYSERVEYQLYFSSF